MESPELSQTVATLLGTAGGSAPLILLIWYMLKDVKETIQKHSETIQKNAHDMSELKLKVASDPSSVKLEFIQQQMTVQRAEAREELKALTVEVGLMKRELAAVWAKIGSRPGEGAAEASHPSICRGKSDG